MAGTTFAGGFTVTVVLYGTRFCPYCIAARALLRARNIDYQDIAVDGDLQLRDAVMARSGQSTVPQIWVGGVHVGGFTELRQINASGELDTLLAKAPANGEQLKPDAPPITGLESQ